MPPLRSPYGAAGVVNGALLAAVLASVTLWHSYQGAERAALEASIAQANAQLAREAQARGEAPVRIESLAIPFDALHRKLETAIPRGHGPDLFLAAHDRLGDWARLGLLRPLPEAVAARWRSRVLPGLAEALTDGRGRLLAFPFTFKGLVLYRNRQLVRDAPPDMAALEALAPAMRARGGWALGYDTGSFFFHAPFFLAHGARVFAEPPERGDPPPFAVFDRRARASYAYVIGLAERGVIPREVSSATLARLFEAGRLATVISGPWFAGQIDLPADRWAVSALPRLRGRRLGSFVTVEGLFVAASSRDVPAAVRAAQALLDAWRVRARRGLQPPVLRSAWRAPERAALPPLVAAQERALAHGRVTPNRPEMALVWEPVGRLLKETLWRGEPLEPALARARTALAIASRPPPPARDPAPWLVVAGVLLLGACGWALVRARRLHLVDRVRRERFPLLMSLPAAVAVALLVGVPLLTGVVLSLFAHVDGGFRFVGWANFVDLLGSRSYGPSDPLSFWFTLGVTVLWTAVNVALHVTIGLVLALALARTGLRFGRLWRVLLILPWAVPNYITALVWRGLFDTQLGAINALLGLAGLEPVAWFQRFWTAFGANVVTNTWLGFPFMMVVALGALQSVPRELEEVARLAGANRWQRFRHVEWPFVRPALVPAVLLGSVWTFNMFNVIYLVSGGEPGGATEILISEAYKWAFERRMRYGYAAAYAVLIFAILLLYGRFVLGGRERDAAVGPREVRA
ncbi:MAG: extracellular solute-binding protein [Planctomycetota bacterium]|nr:MAG: extracellular solute-binding protein [Planctomycetota bacterium]